MTQSRHLAAITGLLMAIALLLLSGPARAADNSPQSYVVLIGISDYADKQIKPRPMAENDAKGLYDLFTNKSYFGVEQDHVRLLLGKPDTQRKSQPATADNILKAVRWLAENSKKDDLAIFAFVGEGAPLGDKSGHLCYLGVDSKLADRSKTAVSTSEALDKMKSQRFCAFVDVNFHGYKNEPVKIASPSLTGEAYREFLGPVDKEEENSALPGRALYLANSGLSASPDREKDGIFTFAVLEGLRGKADKDGYEADGVVTTDELATYLEKEMPELARKFGKTDAEKKQFAPVFETALTHFVITRNPAVEDQVRKRLNALSSLAEEKKISAEVANEGKALLERMPKLKMQQDLRKEYQKLVDGAVTSDEFTKSREKVLAGMKMTHEKAREYAAKVIQASQHIHDSYVKDTNQGELVAWAIRGLYKDLEEKIPTDIKEKLDKIKNLKESQLTEMLTDVRERLGSREDLDRHKDIDISLKRMTGHLDPHTTYIDPETINRFRTETTGNFTGIGITINATNSKGFLQVISPIKGSPAYKAGIKAGDLITDIIRLVDNEGHALPKPEVTSTKGMTTSDAAGLITGKPGTKVKVRVEREGHAGPMEFEVKRDVVDVETVAGARRDAKDDWDFYLDPKDKIAYIRLASFARHTARDTAAAMKKLSASGINGLILDVRENPGGLLNSAVDISDMFVDDGLIVTIRPRVGRELSYAGEHEGSYLGFPMVCLVDSNSASGSEIVAACLQDHKRAIIMGERSYGKGSVQTIQPFEGGEMKVTTASFWRPNGKNLNKLSTKGQDSDEWGVTPNKGFVMNLNYRERRNLYEHFHDSEIIPRHDTSAKERAKEKEEEFKDRQLGMAIDYLKNQISKSSKSQMPKGASVKKD
jgi:carboxyl-terminal processing protease